MMGFELCSALQGRVEVKANGSGSLGAAGFMALVDPNTLDFS